MQQQLHRLTLYLFRESACAAAKQTAVYVNYTDLVSKFNQSTKLHFLSLGLIRGVNRQ